MIPARFVPLPQTFTIASTKSERKNPARGRVKGSGARSESHARLRGCLHDGAAREHACRALRRACAGCSSTCNCTSQSRDEGLAMTSRSAVSCDYAMRRDAHAASDAAMHSAMNTKYEVREQ